MKERARQLEHYVREVLGITVITREWPDVGTLPRLLRQQYEIRTANLLGQACLLLFEKEDMETPPAVLKKHIGLIGAKHEREIIYVQDRVTSYNRKRLIDQEVSFIVPGNQMYLPLLGIDLREHFRLKRSRKSNDYFAPSTQTVLINWLLGDTTHPRTATELAPRLGYSKMTMKRAVDELESQDYVTVAMEGKDKRIQFTASKKVVWLAAQTRLRSPVKRKRPVASLEKSESRPAAGITALSYYSMLASPRQETLAVTLREWKSIRTESPENYAAGDNPDSVNVEIWTYDPALFSVGGYVDPLSLYLSLRDHVDERVEAALEEMIGGLKWS